MSSITIAYTPQYLDWKLGEGHPTNPERARIAVEALTAWAAEHDVDLCAIRPELNPVRVMDEAGKVHSSAYLHRFHNGFSEEWGGCQPRLRDVAGLMFTGTMDLVEDMLGNWRLGVWFNPQGAKHHAQYDNASGFCVLNDMAWAARRFVAEGKRVLYVDWDAHHGDGVEALLLETPGAVTASIHDATIFPWTGLSSDPIHGAYNWPLPAGSGDEELFESVVAVCELARGQRPDVLLLACGADGLAGDPLSTLRYTQAGILKAAWALGRLAAKVGAPVLVGGAGGYRPLDETPGAWVTTIQGLYGAIGGSVGSPAHTDLDSAA